MGYWGTTNANALRRAVPAGVLVASLALALLDISAAQEPRPPGSERMQARARTLMDRFARGDSVTMVAFGDSLTAGWGAEGHDTYHRVVADVLQYRFPGSTLTLVISGHPGETTEDALGKLDPEVIAHKPDLVLIQFGGNDKGWGRDVGSFRTDLAKLLRLTAEGTDALVIACLPPIIDENPRNEWNETAREVAASEGIPAADFDRAIRDADPDFRGPFPYGSHPDGFTHFVMAKEVLRALDEAAGIKPHLHVDFATGPVLAAGESHTVSAALWNSDDEPLVCQVRTDWPGRQMDGEVTVEPGGVQGISHEIALPLQPFDGHSYRFPVRIMARGGGFGAIDLCRLAVAPAITVDRADGDTVDGNALTWHPIPPDRFTMGRHHWFGPVDLDARFATVVLPDRLRFVIEVTDDSMSVATLSDPSKGDSAELYLDLRPDADQGKPVYDEAVLALQIIPPAQAGAGAQWQSMQKLPDDLSGIAVDCRLRSNGYRIVVDVPLAPIVARRGEQWGGLGLDIGINDADFGRERDSQLMWTGHPDNYLNPAYLGGLYLEPVEAGATRRTLQ
jgi:lysophospholipase L1-like esterase